MASKKMKQCDSTSLYGEITFSAHGSSVAVSQFNAELNLTDAIIIDAKDLSRFVLFLADMTKDHEDESTFKGAELEQ